jgi:hypothetical protein
VRLREHLAVELGLPLAVLRLQSEGLQLVDVNERHLPPNAASAASAAASRVGGRHFKAVQL